MELVHGRQVRHADPMQVLSGCRQRFEDLAPKIALRVMLRDALLDGLPIRRFAPPTSMAIAVV
jgi:hypothetical protein